MRLSRATGALMALSLLFGGCSSDGSDGAAPSPSTTSTTTGGGGTGVGQNACPVDGCEITIVDARPDGKELRVTWKANFRPDFSKNHVHVFWDIYTADQVTNDAASRGETQGEWVPTDEFPEFVTEGSVSTSVRGRSTRICVTAGDRDHNVIDSSIVDCRNVADVL